MLDQFIKLFCKSVYGFKFNILEYSCEPGFTSGFNCGHINNLFFELTRKFIWLDTTLILDGRSWQRESVYRKILKHVNQI